VSALGPRGVTVLSLAGIAGLCLAIIGWTQRGTGVVNPLVTGSPSPSVSASAAPSTPAAGPSATATPSAPASSSSASSSSASPSQAAGPRLSSQPYASYAYEVWPGPLNADDKLALTGFNLTVTRAAGGITVKAIQDGTPMTSVSHFYPGGARVYVLDSDLGDDGGGNVDYDESDDGLIVTNAQGQVLP
jgi:hypothetical protein